MGYYLAITAAVEAACQAPKFFSDIDASSLKNFRRDYKMSFRYYFPQFSSEETFTVNDQEVLIGTILKRPLSKPIKFVSSLNIEYHYGVVLGKDTNGTLFLIEMTSPCVRIVCLKDFLCEYGENNIMVDIDLVGASSRDLIIERAIRYEDELYHVMDLNCKDFAYFIRYEIEPTKRSIIAFEIKKYLIDWTICWGELELASTENVEYKKKIEGRIKDLIILRGMSYGKTDYPHL